MIALIKTFTLQQTSAVSEHFPGDNKVASSFALAHGGYELDGVILDKELEKTKLIRQR